MEELLGKPEKRVVGVKQVLRAVESGKAERVFLGKDADSFLYNRVNNLCEEKRVPVTVVESMTALGKLCRVSVASAAAAVLK